MKNSIKHGMCYLPTGGCRGQSMRDSEVDKAWLKRGKLPEGNGTGHDSGWTLGFSQQVDQMEMYRMFRLD